MSFLLKKIFSDFSTYQIKFKLFSLESKALQRVWQNTKLLLPFSLSRMIFRLEREKLPYCLTIGAQGWWENGWGAWQCWKSIQFASPDQGQGQHGSSACSLAVVPLSQTISNVRAPKNGLGKSPRFQKGDHFEFCRLHTYSCEGSPNKIVMHAIKQTVCAR